MDIEKLKSIGGSEWIKDDYHRIYFNEINELAGLEMTYYGTGNVSGASFRGEHISNTRAKKIRADSTQKLWYDVKTGEFASRGVHSELLEAAIEGIRNRVEGEA